MNFMSIVPAGMIVFFPSYKFLNTAKAMWIKTGTLDKFALKKPVCGKKVRRRRLYQLKSRFFLNLRRIQRLRKFFRNMRWQLPRYVNIVSCIIELYKNKVFSRSSAKKEAPLSSR